MLPRISDSQSGHHPTIHFGSLEAMLVFLDRYPDAEHELCLKSVVSPLQSLGGERAMHYGVCVSFCIYGLPGQPIAYTTFLASTRTVADKHSRILYPQLTQSDELRNVPVAEAAKKLRQTLFFTVKEHLRSLGWADRLVLDAQWEMKDPWQGIGKGWRWTAGKWEFQAGPEEALFTEVS
jgi:hypothetical protein